MDRIYRIKQGSEGRYAVERDGQFFWVKGDIFGGYEAGEPVPSGGPHRFLSPVTPSIVVCIGLNYKDHAAEMNKKLPAEPLVFLKPQSSVIGPERCDSAAGVGGTDRARGRDGVVIKKRASHVTAVTPWTTCSASRA